MKRIIVFTLFIFGCYLNGYSASLKSSDSTDTGIHFQRGLSWKDILLKAKVEHKFIFIDCYATWCVPCKEMEKEVYPLKDVGDVYNKFICVKYQIDTSRSDNDSIKAAYADAHFINKHYVIKLFPTFLFLDSDGHLLINGGGKMDATEFINFAKSVTDPANDYNVLLTAYKDNKETIDQLGKLAIRSIARLVDSNFTVELKEKYLKKLKPNDWLTVDNINFMQTFTQSYRDPGFNFFFKNTSEVNRLMKDNDFSQRKVFGVIYNQLIVPVLKKDAPLAISPNWHNLEKEVSRKFNAYYAKRVIIGAKETWYRIKKEDELYCKYMIEYQEKYPTDTSITGHWVAFGLNNLAWAIFGRTTNLTYLKKALKFSSQAVLMDPQPNWMDTYANILYKIGNQPLAISWEEFAVKNDPSPEFKKNLSEMTAGKPTWPQKK